MQRAIDNNIKFIHADEAVFTFNTFIKKSWYKKYDNKEVYDQKVKVVTHAILSGISEESALESYVIHPHSIKREQYIEFLNKLRNKYNDQEIILFFDNLSVHKTKESKKAYQELNITPAYNVPYSPQFNGIEFYWSQIKTHYKKCCCIILCMTCPSIQQTQFRVAAREQAQIRQKFVREKEE